MVSLDGSGGVDQSRAVPTRPTSLATPAGDVRTPVFVPDATRGVIRGVTPDQLRAVGVEALLVSTAHLAGQPGASVVAKLGGIHEFTAWQGPIVSDSGGFQAFSLLTANGLGQLSDRGFRYRFSPKEKYRQLTPESAIQAQVRMGADIVYCLDLCTSPKATREDQERSVELTERWARQCRRAFDALMADRDPPHPLLFAVVQGGPHADLRARCAETLAEIGFDGFGFGGYPVLEGRLVDEVVGLRDLVPDAPLHGLGIGSPDNLIAAWAAGYDVFDCVLPTRNGRRGVLYRMSDDPLGRDATIARMDNQRWIRERGPIDPTCDCPACSTFSAGYLAHLFAIEDRLAATLGSLHNLRFYVRLLERLRAAERPG
jgi:queuine tRNA-ribosyltransferase